MFFFKSCVHCGLWFFCFDFHSSPQVFVFTFPIMFLSSFFILYFCTFDSSNAFATTFSDFGFSTFKDFSFLTFNDLNLLAYNNFNLWTTTFNKFDFARWIFNFVLWICCKLFALTWFFLCCFVVFLKTFCNLQDSRYYALTILSIVILSKLPCTYTWVVICKLVLFLHCLG